MDLNQLRTFQLVASYKSFSKAARSLHLTQPAVTLQIKNLEEELGELLIERLGHSLSLTPAGEVLLNYTQQILNLTDQALVTIRQFSMTRGRLTIGAGTTNTIFRLPGILQVYHQNFPQIEVQIRSGDSELISRLVYENTVDLGLVTTINPGINLNNIPLFEDQILLIAPQNFRSKITIHELEAESLILFRTGSGFRRFLEEKFHECHFTPKVTMELESIEAIIRLVESGLGLAFLPEIAIKEELNNGALKKVALQGWESVVRQTFLIYRHDKYLTWPIKAFLSQLGI